MAQSWQIKNKSIAMRLESRIKKLSRQNREKIINEPDLVHTFIE